VVLVGGGGFFELFRLVVCLVGYVGVGVLEGGFVVRPHRNPVPADRLPSSLASSTMGRRVAESP